MSYVINIFINDILLLLKVLPFISWFRFWGFCYYLKFDSNFHCGCCFLTLCPSTNFSLSGTWSGLHVNIFSVILVQRRSVDTTWHHGFPSIIVHRLWIAKRNEYRYCIGQLYRCIYLWVIPCWFNEHTIRRLVFRACPWQAFQQQEEMPLSAWVGKIHMIGMCLRLENHFSKL